MRGHIKKRGAGYALVLDMGRQSARRCTTNHRSWVRDYQGDNCPRCGERLGDPRSERRQRWETHRLRSEAEEALARYISEVNRGGDPFPRDVTVRAYLSDWLDRRGALVRPRTLARYRQLANAYLLPDLGDARLDRVRRADVQRVFDSMSARGLAPRTVQQARAVLHRAFQDAFEGDLLPRNPVAGTRSASPSLPSLAVLSPHDVRAVLAASDGTSWAVPVLLAATTGARRSEVLALRWSDIDLDSARVTIRRSLQLRPDPEGDRVEFLDPKTKRSRRTVRLTPSVVERLRAHRAEQATRRLALGIGWRDMDLVCEDGTGGPLHPDSMSKAFKRLAARAGLDPRSRLHDLHHAVAVLLALEGVPLEAVSAVLGHASPGFTLSVYAHSVDEMTASAAAAVERRLGRR